MGAPIGPNVHCLMRQQVGFENHDGDTSDKMEDGPQYSFTVAVAMVEAARVDDR